MTIILFTIVLKTLSVKNKMLKTYYLNSLRKLSFHFERTDVN